jgi:hypothetical protein
MVLEHRAQLDKEQQEELDNVVAKYQSTSQAFNSTGKEDAPKTEPPKPAPPKKRTSR